VSLCECACECVEGPLTAVSPVICVCECVSVCERVCVCVSVFGGL